MVYIYRFHYFRKYRHQEFGHTCLMSQSIFTFLKTAILISRRHL